MLHVPVYYKIFDNKMTKVFLDKLNDYFDIFDDSVFVCLGETLNRLQLQTQEEIPENLTEKTDKHKKPPL